MTVSLQSLCPIEVGSSGPEQRTYREWARKPRGLSQGRKGRLGRPLWYQTGTRAPLNEQTQQTETVQKCATTNGGPRRSRAAPGAAGAGPEGSPCPARGRGARAE